MPTFYKVEINRTEWEVPERYQMLTPVGSGAYGQVWWVNYWLAQKDTSGFETEITIIHNDNKNSCHNLVCYRVTLSLHCNFHHYLSL